MGPTARKTFFGARPQSTAQHNALKTHLFVSHEVRAGNKNGSSHPLGVPKGVMIKLRIKFRHAIPQRKNISLMNNNNKK